MSDIGVRTRKHDDPQMGRLARDVDEAVRALAAKLIPPELAPVDGAEVRLPFTWKGRPIYMLHFEGVVPSGGQRLATGAERVLATMGFAKTTLAPTVLVSPAITSTPTDSVCGQVQLLVDADGNMSFGENGTLYEDAVCEMTVFYTRREAR